MTIVSERVFTVTVKVEAPTIAAVDEAFASLEQRLEAAVPGRLSGLRVLSKDVTRKLPRPSAA